MSSFTWSANAAVWLAPGSNSSTVWTPDATAFFNTGSNLYISFGSAVSAEGIFLSGAGTRVVFNPSVQTTLSLTGTGVVLSNTSDQEMVIQNGVNLQLASPTQNAEQTVEVGEGASVYIGSQILGSSTLIKTGEGRLSLDNINTYSGTTILREGLIEANQTEAFGTSTLKFEGGRLGFGSNDHSAQYTGRIADVAAGQFAKFENQQAHSVSLTGGIKGSGGLEKWGSGALVLSAGNTYTGTTHVREGVLRASAGASGAFVVDPFGRTDKVVIHEGATLDVNGNGTGTGGQNTRKYIFEATGLGAEGLATLWNSGIGITNSSIFSQINFTDRISFGSDTRFDISGTVLNGGTNTFEKRGSGELAFSSSSGSTFGDIDLTKGMFTIQSAYLGSASHKFILRESTTLNFWVNEGYSIYKHVEAYDNTVIRASGSAPNATSNYANTATWTGNVNLVSGKLTWESNSGFRNSIHKGVYSGAGNLHISGTTSTSLLSGSAVRTSTHFLLNAENTFTGDIQINNAIVRLSDASLSAGNGGKLGNGSNTLTFNTDSNDGRSALDLHGTHQTLGSLNSIGTGTGRIQNRRAGTTSTLKVGNGNANGQFSGIIEDSSSTFLGGEISSDGTTGKIALEKLGSGTQVFTKANTFSGGLQVRAGTVQLGNNLEATSSAKAGNSAFTVYNGATLSGNGIVGHAGLNSSVQSGGRLVVGVTGQTAAQRLTVAGALQHAGTLEIDIFSAQSGTGDHLNSDTLTFQNNSSIQLQGTLKVTDNTNNSTSWTVGTWFRVLDWTNVSTTQNRDVLFSAYDLPTLGASRVWDYSELAQTGRITVAMIPEPSQAILMTAGLFLLGARRRRAR